MKFFRQQANRTVTALAFTLCAVAGPCIAWYLVGSRESRQRAAELENAPQRQARDAAQRLAERIRDRLETLRENESKRPFYHYQNFYHDPRGAYEGYAVVPSPLADGPLDPVIRTYFQLDAWGRFTLPQLNPLAPQPDQTEEARIAEDAIRRQLELQAPTVYVVTRDDTRQIAEKELATSPAATGNAALAETSALPASPAPRQSLQRRVQVLDAQAWAQNLQASDVYFNLKQRAETDQKDSSRRAADKLEKIKNTGKGTVQISIGPLLWHTIAVNRIPSLVAVRDVQTPNGRAVQGFLISQQGITDMLNAAPFPAQFIPGEAGSAGGAFEVPVKLDGEWWHVIVDARLDLADARAKASAVRAEFLRTFFFGVAIASFAGVFVIWLVWQSERLARQRSQFAASAAHELRTPLAGLRIYSEMLAEGLGDPTRARDYARRVADEAERLGRVVANVLGFSRIERGMLHVQPEPGNLANAVREAIARQQPTLEALGITLNVTIPDSLPMVRFDRDAVPQILQNLLDNAEKHTRNAPDRVIHVTLEMDAPDMVELSVADQGTGIPKKTRRRLFRPFFRGNDAEAPAGLGLGLTLVRALAQAQGGEVRYVDNIGGGARFIVTLPVAQEISRGHPKEVG